MRRKLTVSNCTIAAAILLLIGCESDRREADINADTTAIKTVIEHVAEAWKAGDWDTFAEFYTDDTIWMPPGEAPLRGKDALRAWVQPIWNDYTVVEINMPSEEIVVIDDWAYERHFELLEIYEVGGEPTQYYLKGVRIFRRGEDGSWKIARYIWNGDVPPD
jgi:uncharacterized protein (TIGR02246 family)